MNALSALSHLFDFATGGHFRRRRRVRKAIMARLATGPEFGRVIADGYLSPGAIYVFLAQMEDDGLIEGFDEPNPPLPAFPRRMYRLPVFKRKRGPRS